MSMSPMQSAKVERFKDQIDFDAVISRDFQTVQAVTLLMAGALLLSNLIADLLYGVADPRIRYE